MKAKAFLMIHVLNLWEPAEPSFTVAHGGVEAPQITIGLGPTNA